MSHDDPERKPSPTPPGATVRIDPNDADMGATVRMEPSHGGGSNPTVKWSPEELARLAQSEAEAAAAAERQEDPLIGTLIRNKWRVLKRIGAGSFGTVYKVEDIKGGWVEALKILGVDRLTGSEAEEMRGRFLREAQIMKRLGTESQHIVGLATYEEDIEAGLIYFLMEFVEGESLAAKLEEEGPFDVERTIRVAKQVCEALMVAHEGPEPVVHRDLKLENLMLTKDRSGGEIVKVLDFGIAKIAEKDADSRLTTVGTLGTPGYAAPEQLRAEGVDGRTDLFAFGVILYALLTGRDPWLGRLAHEPTHQIYELMVATDRGNVRPMSEAGVSVPPAMVQLITKLLRRDPARRFQSARELKEALERIEAGDGDALTLADVEDVTPVTSRRADPVRGRVAPKPRKRSRKGRIAAMLVVALGLAGAAYAQPWGRTLHEPELQALIDRGRVTDVWITEDGVEGGVIVAPSFLVDAAPMLADFRTPFFMLIDEGGIPDFVSRLGGNGVSVDASLEIRRLTDLAVEAQTRSRYFGVAGGDVKSYALRLADLDPGSDEAASLLLKVGERMAWDAESALEGGPSERADELLDECLALVPDHPRCLAVAGAR